MIGNHRKSKRFTAETDIAVYDCSTNQSLGKLVNLSIDGAMLVSEKSVKPAASFPCRMELEQQILGRTEIYFDAECRWCRKNIALGRWESGYRLSASGIDAYLISYLMLKFELYGQGKERMPEVRTVEMANRRKSVRFEFETPLPVFEFRNYRQLGTVIDLSIGGIGIITDQPMKKEDVLQCRIRLPHTVFNQEFLVLQLKCMWCRKEKYTLRYKSGHAFVI